MPLMQFHDREATLEFGKKDEGKKKVLFCSEAGLLRSCSVHSLLRWGDALLALQNAFNQSSLCSAPLYSVWADMGDELVRQCDMTN